MIHVSFLTALLPLFEGKYDDYEEELVGFQYREMLEIIEMMPEMMPVRIFEVLFLGSGVI